MEYVITGGTQFDNTEAISEASPTSSHKQWFHSLRTQENKGDLSLTSQSVLFLDVGIFLEIYFIIVALITSLHHLFLLGSADRFNQDK